MIPKCVKCETEFSLGTKFCESCGCNLEVEFIETPTCPVCKKTFPTGTKFCNEHGTKLASPEQLIPRCSKCEKQYTDGTKFCPDCGGSVRVSILLTNRSLSSANDFVQTIMPDVASNFAENLRSKYSISIGMLAGTIGVILFSLFDWVRISDFGFSVGASPFGIVRVLVDLQRYLPIAEMNLLAIPAILLGLSFVLLITSLFMKPHLIKVKSILAYVGFGLCAIVAIVIIIAMMIIQAEIQADIGVNVSLLTVFPFLTLAVAILAMIFAIERPTKMASSSKNVNTSKQRHVFVSAWLIFLIIGSSLSVIISLLLIGHIVIGLLSAANVVFLVMLYQWKKIGFWGFVGTSIVTFIILLSTGSGIGQFLFGLVSIAILYGVLQIKRNNVTAWENLE